jgi:hypothetical protein
MAPKKKKPQAKQDKSKRIRSSAAEYLTFIAAGGGSDTSVEMRYEDENLWLTQKLMAELYDVSVPAINQHLKRIFGDQELTREATIKKYLIVQTEGKIHPYDVSVAKNYLSKFELAQMQRIVSAYLDMAEMLAMRKIPMTMQDWEKRLSGFLQLWDRKILQDAGKVTAELAKAHAESEFEKYRIVQDQLFESDFDKMLQAIEPEEEDLPEAPPDTTY